MKNPRGSILILALWLVAMMALLSLSVGYTVRQYLTAVQKIDTRDKLRLIAEAGVKKALFILNHKPPDRPVFDSLRDRWSSSEADFKDIRVGNGVFSVRYENLKDDLAPKNPNAKAFGYGVIDEERKIHLNRMNVPAILTRLFQYAASLSPEEASALADCVLDWRDADESRNPYGAESDYYKFLKPPYRAKNADFSSLEELMLVKGVTPQIFDRVAPYLTLYGTGRINLNTASSVVLRAIGLSDSLVKKIMAFRVGRDQKQGTSDDGIFKSLESIAVELNDFQNLDDTEKRIMMAMALSGYIMVQGENFTIRSFAHLPGRPERVEVTCVFQRYGRILEWREKFGIEEIPQGSKALKK